MTSISDDTQEKIKYYFDQINKLLDALNQIIYEIQKQNESLQRKNESTLRKLYKDIFSQKLINEALENKILNLQKKEKEYELLKEKTGAIVCNGEVICNERKENEIIILRTENSLLKNAIKNNEDLLQEKNNIINNLNNDINVYKSQLDELRNNKHGKYSSFSNISININEPKQKNGGRPKGIPHGNPIQLLYSSKSLRNEEQSKDKNNKNNIYSSYQINSQLINKTNNNKNFSNKKEKIFNNNNNNNNNQTIDILGNKTYSIKYISVNKSLFSPKINKKQKIEIINTSNNNSKKSLQINRINKNKNMLINNYTNREYTTISFEPCEKKQVQVKTKSINNKFPLKTKNSYSKKLSENSINKLLLNDKKEKSFSNEKYSDGNIYFTMRKINQMKKQNTKVNKSLPSSVLNTVSEGFRKKNAPAKQKGLKQFLIPYADRHNDNRGRNENNSKIGNECIKDNSFLFLQKTFMSRTICENYSHNDKKL